MIKGHFFFKHWGGPLGVKGISDIIGAIKGTGQAFFIEIKKKGKNPTPDQKLFLESARRAGAKAFVARCIEDVQMQGI